MSYDYVLSDGSVLRTKAGRPPIGIEINIKGQWKPYPEPESGEIGQSSIAAWLEGRKLTEAEDEELIEEATV